ncbi:cell wall elongation regulator TseB-like domain-containing protein [Paenibacillus radicis (ex Gao et al. 2016)]|uniref:Cell wall elongation regulator TseB-like domain-containing protein n=1 Tax=Paenibacillus radicis (ex Gao et al. 2016) TaxID=1737354 RepID=A0A917GVG8_9BACL|nr:DUF5590 domain-containing protein [Paenibacillus radicis (ex Gao et al. 2016)]GGG58529.1 hypothetical protein GCM10010918_09570 [Paenibacillus radicis (ex Gao et al. 2016)]
MRAVTKKRKPIMSAKRWLTLSILLVIALLAAVFIYYRSVQLPYWSQEASIRNEAVEAAQLKSVTKATKHVWDRAYWIVEGTDESDTDVYVWIAAKEKPDANAETGNEATSDTTNANTIPPLIIKASEAASKDAIRESFLQAKPDAEIKRLQPGMLNGEPVWEIYFSREEHTTKYYYEFYSFRDGSFITEYRLPARISA